jgi:hypothetical protein
MFGMCAISGTIAVVPDIAPYAQLFSSVICSYNTSCINVLPTSTKRPQGPLDYVWSFVKEADPQLDSSQQLTISPQLIAQGSNTTKMFVTNPEVSFPVFQFLRNQQDIDW